jgi:hypothetical protein
MAVKTVSNSIKRLDFIVHSLWMAKLANRRHFNFRLTPRQQISG